MSYGRRGSSLLIDIERLDKITNLNDPLEDYYIEQDVYSDEEVQESDPVREFRDAARQFYVADVIHEYVYDDHIFRLASACPKSKEVSN